ncbi:MAG: efflux RND transporter permease subunit [Bacteroidetes bacterium]|nr:efflux RND transporter permease subunit [Bacteroidota bacterium]
MLEKFKEFKPTSWAIDNKTTIYLLTVFITLAGMLSYNSIPKEQFPDIVIPTIYVSTVYPGAAPKDVENLVSKNIEKQIKSIAGVKKVQSTSIQDFSSVVVEFNTDVDVPTAKQKVKDAVDKAKKDLPQDLPADPNVMEVEFSEMPILFVNIAGNYDLDELKKYAEILQDRIEGMKEITRVDMVGALEREIQVNVDLYQANMAKISLQDIERSLNYENMTISGGAVEIDDMKRTLSVNGEFNNIEEIKNIVITGQTGAKLYLKDIAEVVDGHKTQESYGRLDKKNVITLNVIKRGGENLINASDEIHKIIEELKKEQFPNDLSVVVTGDQSRTTRITLHDLINTIIIGFILVTLILMFFMGATNAIFVGLSVPLSMFIAFLVLPGIDFTMNMIVLFAFLLGLGIVVDDAIVVIENTHRIYDNGKVPIKIAAKKAAGEIFLPVLSGTATTLAPFVPLAFWGGVIGKFMMYLPITLIITLTASLVVAYIINPVFAVDFMKPHEYKKAINFKKLGITSVIMVVIAAMGYASGNVGFGNFAIFMLLVYLVYRFILKRAIEKFQHSIWPRFQNFYARFLTLVLKRPRTIFVGMLVLLVLSIGVTIVRSPKVVFFPRAEPNFVYVYASLPVGTKAEATDSVAKIIEDRIYGVIGENNPTVESVITNIAVGANESQDDRAPYSHKAKVGVAFVEFSKRNGQSTTEYLEKIRAAVQGIPGVEISVDQEQNGPPTAKPINIEISGENFEDLIQASVDLKNYLDAQRVPGVEELKSDLQRNKPEIIIDVDRERCNREGLSMAQVGIEIRKAIFGIDNPTSFRDDEDEYPVQIRLKEEQRNNLEEIKNIPITFRDMTMMGQVRQVPISAFADVKYSSTYAGIKRKNQKRVVTLSSNVMSGFNPNEVANQIKEKAAAFDNLPKGVTVNLTGEQEEQAETASFLGTALMISMALIILILIMQFNSIGRTVLIMSEILFSVIGVLIGLAIFEMDISIVMTGVGIVALAGIVVRNGILLVEFTDILRKDGSELIPAIIEAGRVRMTPVLLTATATILGMIPLAVGFNIDFVSMFTELDPKIYFGGDSVAFWGPLSWTIVFGLSFATVITLILVPVMYLLSERTKERVMKIFGKKNESEVEQETAS